MNLLNSIVMFLQGVIAFVGVYFFGASMVGVLAIMGVAALIQTAIGGQKSFGIFLRYLVFNAAMAALIAVVAVVPAAMGLF